MKKLIWLAILLIAVALIPPFVPQPTLAMTGSGTSGDPYVIYNVTDLQNMNLASSAYYVLNNSIDASATATWNWNAGRGVYEGFVPISFSGNFDGHGYAISGLYINRYSTNGLSLGLFSNLGTGAVVRNATLDDVYVKGATAGIASACSAGMLVGYIAQSSLVEYVIVSGEVIAQCNDTYGGNGHSSGNAGGLVGYVGGSVTVRYCASYGEVTAIALDEATAAAGGLIGYFWAGTIQNCYSRCSPVTASYEGYPAAYAAGLVGCHINSGTITKSYSTGMPVSNDPNDRGGLVAGPRTATTYSFWDTDTSGMAVSSGGTGKTTSEMKTQTTYTGAGWDFDTVWTMKATINDGYPVFRWWYAPVWMIDDVYQVLWFQPNAIIEGTTLPDRAETEDGIITWGANPAGISLTLGEFTPEEEYDFESVIPGGQDIIKPEPGSMVGDVDTERLRGNPLYPLVQVLSIDGFLNERLVWLGLAWLIVIGAMFLVHLGFDTKKGTEKPQHFILTTITGLGLSILFYTMGVFPLWVVILMSFGLVGAIIWERQPVM